MSEQVIVESPAVQAPVSSTGEREWVEEAELAANAAQRRMLTAYNAYLVAKAECDRLIAVAGNRRAVRAKRTYTPYPGAGTALTTETAQQSTPRTVPGEAAEASDG